MPSHSHHNAAGSWSSLNANTSNVPIKGSTSSVSYTLYRKKTSQNYVRPSLSAPAAMPIYKVSAARSGVRPKDFSTSRSAHTLDWNKLFKMIKDFFTATETK